MEKTSPKLLSCFFVIASPRKSTICSTLSQAHIIAPFNYVLKRVVLAILNANESEPITWQQINLHIDSGGQEIGIDARTSYAAFTASFLPAAKAAS